jgi:xylulokinase
VIFIGIDCGTQSLKTIAWNSDTGAIVGSSSEAYELIEGLPPGHKEQHPSIWIDALHRCFAGLRDQGVDLQQAKGIGVSGQQHGLVVLDASHQVIRPSKLWCDTSTQGQCRQIMTAAGGEEEYKSAIGNSLPPGFTASKILWLRQNEPENYSRVRHILLPHDYLNFYLTGEMTAEAGDSSGTGYFDVRNRQWSKEALNWIDPDRDLSGCLAPLISSRDAAGRLRPQISRDFGLPEGVVVSSGGGDNMMGAIGSGNVRAGTVTVSLGTSGTLFSYSDSPVIDPDGEIAAFCDSTGGWLPLGCTMNVTVATEMIRGEFLKSSLADFNRAIEGVRPGSDGLVLVPFLEGERMPNVPLGTGVLLGLRPATATPAHLARAAMEGATLGLRYGLERLRELGIHPAEIRLIGGGSKSRVWRQIAADVFQVPVVCPENQEGPAFGAALQALWCYQQGDIEEIAKAHVKLDADTRTEPDPSRVVTYNRLYEVYSHLSGTLIKSDAFRLHRLFIEGKD